MVVSTGVQFINTSQSQKPVRLKSKSVPQIHPFFGDQILRESGQLFLRLNPNGYIRPLAINNSIGPEEILEYPYRVLSDYVKAEIISPERIEDLERRARPLKGSRILNLNSSASIGGGVADLLRNIFVPFLRGLGIDARWGVMGGEKEFFDVTKLILHNGLQNKPIKKFTQNRKNLYINTPLQNLQRLNLSQADIVICHDPQALPMIEAKIKGKNGAKYIWRCHVDTSTPNLQIWNFLRNFIEKYDAAVFSHPNFIKSDILTKLPIALIPPAIDPLSIKNMYRDESQAKCKIYLKPLFEKYGIDHSKPFALQLSRFDPSKGWDHIVDVARKLKDVQFVLAGPELKSVSDDTEQEKIFNDLKRKTKNDANIFLVELPQEDNQRIVGALFSSSDVVLQLSTKEGFGLTKTEADWINGVTIGSFAGGLSLQGGRYDPSNTDAIAGRVFKLLNDNAERMRLREESRTRVMKHFLLDRYLIEWLTLFNDVLEGRLKNGIVDYNGWTKMTA